MKKKKCLLVFILAIGILVILNFHRIKFTLSLLSLSRQRDMIEAQLEDPEYVEANLENPLEAILEAAAVEDVDSTRDPVDNPHNDANDGSTGNVENTNNLVKDDVSTGNTSTNKPKDKAKSPAGQASSSSKSYVEIILEYNDVLLNLQAEFEAKLDALIRQGIEEYAQGKVSTAKLASKYLSLGADLEKSCDKRFYNLLDTMKDELKANGHDTLITDEIKEYYVSFKKARKVDLINRGMKHLK